MIDPAPFMLMDDASPDRARPARLYRDPVAIVTAQTLDEVVPAMARLKLAVSQGKDVAGYLSYEAGYALEERLRGLECRMEPDGPPLLWFGVFERAEELDKAALERWFDDIAPNGDVGPGKAHAVPLIRREDYDRAFACVKEKIVAGDIYQANCTFACRVHVGDDPVSFYRSVRPHAAAGYGALLFTGDHWLLSFSPELFFTVEGRRLTTRPMKGTARRDDDPVRDAALARELAADPKQRAENLMIVDLLRNDLSRISVPGSVDVPDLFTVEHYPTVHQMVSTVTAQLTDGLDAVDALSALFPCGSITGAPKIRAMEILYDVEGRARGPYTGTIGAINANGDARFNVAIRTICVKKGRQDGVIGLGSGLVADSNVTDEWHECLDKGRFLSGGAKPGRAGNEAAE